MATKNIGRLDWCIEEYFSACLYRSKRGEIKYFVSPQTEFMAKIEYIPFRQHVINIFIKTDQHANLNTVTFYNKKPSSRVDEEKHIVKICGIATNWRFLKTISQYNSDNSDSYSSDNSDSFISDKLHLSFEFIFKKHDGHFLATDIGGHLMDPTYSDVTIRTSEGDELPAHKILLVARSDVFRALFQHDTAEKATNIVECPFPTNMVKHLLAFIYQDKAADIEEIAFDLLVAADYYHLDRLRELCEDVLMETLNVDNAIELLTLAHTHNACYLKTEALLFITKKKNAAEIVQTNEWKLLSHELSKCILEFILTQK